MNLAIVVSLVLPTCAIAICWRWPVARRTLLLYVVMLLVQIPTEIAFGRLELVGMNYVIGYTYTSCWLWQLIWVPLGHGAVGMLPFL